MSASPETHATPSSQGDARVLLIVSRQELSRPEASAPLSDPLPDLRDLHWRHPGVTVSLCESYAEAASVCLSRHHEPPVEIAMTKGPLVCRRELDWQPPKDRARRAWANRDEATRDGAYSLSLAGVEAEYGMVAIARADTGTGADYYVAPPGEHEDLENAYRLEVSGIDQGGESDIRSRLQQKILQVRNGSAGGPALVAVVGFATRRIALKEVEDLR